MGVLASTPMGQRAAGMPAWVRDAVRIRRAPIPVGHSVRAALTVGAPVVVGFAIDDAALGVTIALACVLRTIGERKGPHRTNVSNLLIAAPIAASGYLFGAAQGLPLPALVALMAAAAFVVGTLARHGEGFALGGMQFLLVASIAIGIPGQGVLRPLGLFLVGAALYGVCMVIDYRLFEPEPQPAEGAAPTPSPSAAARVSWLAIDRATARAAGRLALCFGLAVSARGWVDLQHWYWVPATVGLVMQPSFGSVPGRAVLRVVGTVLGALVGALVIAGDLGGTALGLSIGLFAATIPWSKLASYALQSAALSAVVLLLVNQIAPATSVGLPVQRVIAGALGGAIVFVFGYALWPEARRLEGERAG